MADVDLQGPLDDFYVRTANIRSIVIAIESASRNASALSTIRSRNTLNEMGLETSNTSNAMSLVFLASSFEEFVREEVGQCSDYLINAFPNLSDEVRANLRSLYWTALLDRIKDQKTILVKAKVKTIDSALISDLRKLLDSGRSFVADGDAIGIDRKTVFHHRRNFRPDVVDELASRIGVKNFMNDAADSNRLRTYFGVVKKSQVSELLRKKLNEFYARRNELVHSLSSSSGYAVDIVLDYLDLI